MGMLPALFRQQKTRLGGRQTGFVCPARYLQAGANLALAEFLMRPQAEASNRRRKILAQLVETRGGGPRDRFAGGPRSLDARDAPAEND